MSHKSLSRAMLCIALGLGPEFFRCVDINNGGLTTIRWVKLDIDYEVEICFSLVQSLL